MGSFLTKLRDYMRGMPPVVLARMTLIQGVRHLALPQSKLTFADWGEDRIITHYIPKSGWYVDVGCNHPIANSNTWLLYAIGWRGLCIDGNSDLIEQHRRVRPNDTQVCAIVSDCEQDLDFAIFEGTLVSSVDRAHIAHWQESASVVRTETRRARTLTSILDALRVPTSFDLLSVDVEGHDLQVLRSLDFGRYRPVLIVVEVHNLDLAAASSNPVVAYLLARGYKLIGYIVWNAWFMRSDR